MNSKSKSTYNETLCTSFMCAWNMDGICKIPAICPGRRNDTGEVPQQKVPDNRIAYFEVDGMGTIRVIKKNVASWFEREEQDGQGTAKFTIIEMVNGRVIKTRNSIETVDEKLS